MTGAGTWARATFLDLEFDQLDQPGALALISRFEKKQGFSFVVTPNVDHLVRLHSRDPDPALWQAYRSALLCLCDSQILRLLARRAGISLPLVAGSNLTTDLLQDHRFDGKSFAVIGGGGQLLDELRARYPEHDWHHHDPPMGIGRNKPAQAELIHFVENSTAEVFFFAIGSPQSELLCAEIVNRGKARGIALCIGASLEFVAGIKPRAPRWMQKLALEWLFRLASEPGRLWRRYLIEGPAIFRIWWRWRFSRGRPRAECDSTLPGER